jgi:hypothetical protein
VNELLKRDDEVPARPSTLLNLEKTPPSMDLQKALSKIKLTKSFLIPRTRPRIHRTYFPETMADQPPPDLAFSCPWSIMPEDENGIVQVLLPSPNP